MNKFRTILLFLLVINLVLSAAYSDKIKIKTVDGVQVIYNPKNPVPPKGIPVKLRLKEIFSVGESEDDEAKFSEMTAITVDKAGNVYILDRKECWVKVFNNEGKYLRKIGKKGQGPGEMDMPISLHITPKNELVVEDMIARRLAFFTLDGKFMKNVSLAQSLGIGAALKIDSQGSMLAQKFTPLGNKISREIIKLDKDFNLLFTLSKIQMDLSNVIQGKINPFNLAVIYELGKNDDIYLGAYLGDYEIKVFSPEGKLKKKILKEYKPIKITKKDIEEMLSRIPSVPFLTKDRLDLPKYFPPYLAFTLDDEGRLFVRTWNKGNEQREHFFDVFDSEGKYIAKVPLRTEPRLWKKDKVYSIEEDEEGYPILKCYVVHWEE